jgi:hypothetical protein
MRARASALPLDRRRTSEFLSTREAIDILYEVRCDVVHEGKYWSSVIFMREERMMLHRERGVIAGISIEEIRTLIVSGTVTACLKLGVDVPRIS